MKRVHIILAAALVISLAGCVPLFGYSDLIEMEADLGRLDGIQWNENTYNTFANASYNNFYNRNRGSQIGFIAGDKALKIFELKGYDASEWFAFFMYGEVTLYKNDRVTDIPGELLTLRLSTMLPVDMVLEITHILSGQSTEHTVTEIYPIVDWVSGLSLTKETFEPGNTPGDHDGQEVFVFQNSMIETAYVKLGGNESYIRYGSDWYSVKNPSDPPYRDALA